MAKKLGLGFVLLLLLVAGLVGVAINRVMQDPVLLENYLSDSLGREVRIASLRELSLGREVALRVDGLSIANPGGSSEPFFLRLDLARVHLDLFSLFREGPLIITDLELQGLELSLLAPGDAPPNWQFGEPAPSSSASAESVSLPLLLEQAHVRDSQVSYQAESGQLQAEIDGQLRGGDGLSLVIDGQWQDEDVRLDGSTSREGTGLALSGEGAYGDWTFQAFNISSKD